MLWVTEEYKNTAINFKVKSLLFQANSPYQKVEIMETYDWGRILMLDNLMMVTEKDEFFYHESITHLPLALNPFVQNILVIGGGDGGTLRELNKYPQIKKIQIVEIDQMVIESCRQFLPSLACGFNDPRVEVKVQDAGKFLLKRETNQPKFDLIISDSSDPEGFAEILIQKDFYRAVQHNLSPEGLFIAQSGSPISQAQELHKTWSNLNAVFAHTEIAWSLTPSYPGAWWSFVLASKTPFKIPEQIHFTPPQCRFWKPQIIQAMLSRPAFIQSILDKN